MKNSRNDLVVFAHQDVYIPAGWEKEVIRNISYLDGLDPTWAVLGVYGVMKSGQHVGYVWSSGINKILGMAFDYPRPADSIDELLIILKRSSGVTFDENLPGYHLYGTDLVQTALAKNKAAYVICAPVVHNSRPILYLPIDYWTAYKYVSNKWQNNLPIQNCITPLVGPRFPYFMMRIKHNIRKFRYSKVDRVTLDRKYECVEIAKRLGFEMVK